MELTLPAALLARELSLIQGVVEKRTTHQILTNVLLEAKDDRLTLTATDLDTTLLSELSPVSVKSPGAVTAPARRLYDVHTAVWATLLTNVFPPFFLKSIEFRTDNLWNACWMVAVAMVVLVPPLRLRT